MLRLTCNACNEVAAGLAEELVAELVAEGAKASALPWPE